MVPRLYLPPESRPRPLDDSTGGSDSALQFRKFATLALEPKLSTVLNKVHRKNIKMSNSHEQTNGKIMETDVIIIGAGMFYSPFLLPNIDV